MKQLRTFSMQRWRCVTLWVIIPATAPLAHEIPIHERITANAAESAFTYSSAYRDFLNTASLDCDWKTATNALVRGTMFVGNPDPLERAYMLDTDSRLNDD